jgi:DNA helicase-2/ATP-dependent DNA helicase PcrA
MGTFHSIFSRILRKEADKLGYSSDFTIYDSDDSRNLIKAIIKELQLDDKQYNPRAVQSRISRAKNALITSAAYTRDKDLQEDDLRVKMPLLREIYERYQNRCFQAGAMDFDDLLLQTNILFRDKPDILANYAGQFQYILVDEYQDTNFAQHLIVQRLSEGHHRICVVGDDAQSIYSFRGANIDNILQFKNQFPGCRIFKLERNYRSTQNIVNAANSLIHKNTKQIQKNVYSKKEAGNKVQVLSSYSDYEEAYIIVSKIQEMRMGRGHYLYNDFAVLYRINAQSRILEETFRKRGVPYRVYGGFSFYQRKEIKDLIAYLRLIVNPHDEEAFKRIINYPARGIGDTTVGKLLTAAAQHALSPWAVLSDPAACGLKFNGGTLAKLRAFHEMMQGLMKQNGDLPIDKLAALTIHQNGMLQEFQQDRSLENATRMENLNELFKGMADFDNARQEEGLEPATLADYLSEVSLYTDQDGKQDAEADTVTLMTVHSAKGLEFKNVFVAGLEEELFPSSHVKDNPRGLEEERRLFYVAMTRAMENCILTYSKSRFRNGASSPCLPSRFLSDLDTDYLEINGQAPDPGNALRRQATPPQVQRQTFRPRASSLPRPASPGFGLLRPEQLAVGMEIQHERFGHGTVAEVNVDGSDASAIIHFDNAGTKRLILKYARLKVL